MLGRQVARQEGRNTIAMQEAVGIQVVRQEERYDDKKLVVRRKAGKVVAMQEGWNMGSYEERQEYGVGMQEGSKMGSYAGRQEDGNLCRKVGRQEASFYSFAFNLL